MPDSPAPDVVLFRSSDDPDPYIRALGEAGLRAVCVPVLSFTFPNDEALLRHLREFDQFGGLVVTSPRAVRALGRVLEEDDAVRGEWKERTAYVVGPKTGKRMGSLGFAVRGMGAGTADALVRVIEEVSPQRPLLFLSGNRRRDTLPNGLRDAGVAFEECVVYETHVRTDLTLPDPGEDAPWLVYYSPSGVKAVTEAETPPLASYRHAAIGPTTAEAVRAAGLDVEAVAETPSPEGVVRAIRED